MRDPRLIDFVRESNRIEGILREPTESEILAHHQFLEWRVVDVAGLEVFVAAVAGAELRKRKGMNVRVGPHRPIPGGSEIPAVLKRLLACLGDGRAWTPYALHQEYEYLHPFMDGNGRSGRVLWAWHRQLVGRDPFALGFLHSFYYEALERGLS